MSFLSIKNKQHLGWRPWAWSACLLALSLVLAQPARAQQVLVQDDVAADTARSIYGPNRAHFGHLYLGYGLVAGGSGVGAPLRYGFPSYELQLGGRYQRRLGQALALTLDLRYARQRYALRQNAQKTLPSPALHLSESLGLHHLQAEAGLRLSLSRRRGNVLGRYLDLLAAGGWVAGTSHSTEDVPAPSASSVETTERGLAYLRRWTGSAGLRLGTGHLAVVGRYRLTPVFTSEYRTFSELPRWVLGLELALF